MDKDKVKTITLGTGRNPVDMTEGVEIMRKAVGSTYGPGGRNVLLKKKYVQPILTRDGVTVARDIAGFGNKLKDPIAAEAAKLVYQASEKTNKTAGDGTTATVVLLAELYKSGYQRIVAGADPMVVKRQLDKDRNTIVGFIESKSKKCTPEMLKQVATISSGDPELGAMLSDLVNEVGADGAITLEYQNAPSVEVEKVTGYLFSSGFRHLAANEVELDNPLVFVTQKRLASRNDIIPFLEIAAKNQRQFVIIGDVAGAALETLVWAIQNQKADGLSIPPPAYGADGHEYFNDIATYTGAQLILEGDNFKDVTIDYSGHIKKARISRDKATIFGQTKALQTFTNADGSTIDQEVLIGERVAERINEIKKQVTSESSPSQKEALEQRLAKLAGKVSIIKVGAATEVEREELFFRVEDAVEACKSALSSGIVAGGATTLVFASKLDVEPFVLAALQEPFKLLMSNAAESGDYRLHQVLNAGYGKGFDLKAMTEGQVDTVDLYKQGIVDPTKVVLQVVQNAFSVAGALLTTGTVVTEEETDEAK